MSLATINGNPSTGSHINACKQTGWRHFVTMQTPKNHPVSFETCKKSYKAHSEYAIPGAFPWQQWLYICASMLHYTQVACLVRFSWQLFIILFGQPEDRGRMFLRNIVTHVYHSAETQKRPSNKGATWCVRTQKTVIRILTTLKTLYFVFDFSWLFTRNIKLVIKTRCLHSIFRRKN